MPSLKTQALALADYLDSADMTTAEAPPSGTCSGSKLLAGLLERAEHRGAVPAELSTAVKQKEAF